MLLTLVALAAPVRAQPAPAPTDVTTGIFVVQLNDPDLKAGEFTAVFWLWFRWQGDAELNPIEKFEVVGGVVEGLENKESLTRGSTHYQVAKVRARITQGFDLADFPVDRHTLEIAVEETSDGIELIRYVPDVHNSKLQESIALEGWVIGDTAAQGSVKTYASTFGDPAQAEDGQSGYARLTLGIPVRRPGSGYPVKMFWSLYLSVFVALLAFHIKPVDLDPRFGLGVGAVFAAMASAFVISSALPDGNQVTIADKVVMISIGFIVASVIQSIISLRLVQAGKEPASVRLDRWSFVVFVLLYAGVNVYLIRGV